MEKVLSSSILAKVTAIFRSIFRFETKPTRDKLILVLLAIFFTNQFRSIRSLYENCLKYITKKSLSSIYAMFSSSKYVFCNEWFDKTLKLTIDLSNESLKNYPLFIIIDDTNIHKVGTKFEGIRTLFDHCTNKYFDGFNSVCVLIGIYVKDGLKGKKFITVPVGQKLWQPKDKNSKTRQDNCETRFDLLTPWLESIINTIGAKRKIILLCDSFYSRGSIKDLVNKYSNVGMIAAVRNDTVLYDLPPEVTERKRGPRRQKGDRIYPENFEFVKIGNEKLLLAHVKCVTKLFGLAKVVDVFATKSETQAIRLFICTCADFIEYQHLCVSAANEKKAKKYLAVNPNFLPFLIYQYRWNIEVYFNMVKEFWGYESFRVRTYQSITRVLNFISLSFSISTLLPYLCDELSFLRNKSPQEVRHVIGQAFYGITLIQRCAVGAQHAEIIPDLIKSYQNLAFQMDMAC